MTTREDTSNWGLPAHENSIDVARTALVVVDMQYCCVHPDYGLCKVLAARSPEVASTYFDRLNRTVIPNIKRLLAFFRERRMPVIYLTLGSEREDGRDLSPRLQRRNRQMLIEVGMATTPVRGSFEQQVIPEIAPERGDLVLNKTSYGAFNSTSIDQTLRNAGISGLVFTGVATNACVETTARDAADRGYDCILAEDACAALDPAGHEATLVIFAQAFGEVHSTNRLISEFAQALEPTAKG